jgi:hypothetical protein
VPAPSVREQILDHIHTVTLPGTVQVGIRIYRSRVQALSRSEAPALIVSPGEDNPVNAPRTTGASLGRLDQALPAMIEIYVRGNSHNHDGGDGAQIAYNSLLGLPGVVSPSSAGLAPARSFSTITYGATVALDFASLDAQYRTISLTGNLELTTSNLANGRTLVIRLVADANQRTLTFPTDWKFLGTKPANIAASKVGVLSITAFGTTNADVVAAYAVQS